MKPILKTCPFLILFLTFSLIANAGEIILVSGKEKGIIRISNFASPTESYAAHELQRALSLMTGTSLAIDSIGSGKATGSARVIIGTPATNANIAALSEQLKLIGKGQEQIAVQTINNTLYLAGNSSRAALYATYTFLEEVLGARWYWPGPTGEYLPFYKTIVLKDLSIHQTPALTIRSLAITGGNGDPDTQTWMARNKLNLVSARPGSDSASVAEKRKMGFIIRVAGHNIILPDAILKQHPEYLPEIGGKRQPYTRGASHLCWSNTGVQNEVAKMIASWWDQSPYPEIVHFYPADQTQYCQCMQCKAMGDISTRWQKFSQIIIDKVNLTHPGKKYWTYAYTEYKKPPEVQPAPFDFVPYALYDASYRHLLSSGNKYNVLAISEIEQWQKKGVKMGIRGYEFIIFKTPMMTPMVSWVIDEIQWMRSKNLDGYLSELPAYGTPKNGSPDSTFWNCSRMALYAAVKSMWNSDTRPEDIVRDWSDHVYGPASKEMTAYYWELENAWRSNPKKISVFNNLPVASIDGFLTPVLFQQFYRHFSNALVAIESVTDSSERHRIEGQLALERKMLSNWQETYNLKTLRAERYNVLLPHEKINRPLVIDNFETEGGLPSPTKQAVSITWDTERVNFKIALPTTASSFKGNYTRHVTKEPPLFELYIQPALSKSSLTRIQLFKNGSFCDATSFSGLQYKGSASSGLKVYGNSNSTAYVINLSIPFEDLMIAPLQATQFRMAFRSFLEPGMAGWPDAYEPFISNFSLVKLTADASALQEDKIILFDSGLDSGPLSVDLQQQGWKVAFESSDQSRLEDLIKDKKVNTVLVRYQGLKDKKFPLSNDFMGREIGRFVQSGGMLVISGAGDIPIDSWFSTVSPVKWINTDAPVRRTSYVAKGEWLSQPNDLHSILKTGVTPYGSYSTEGSDWTVLGKGPGDETSTGSFLMYTLYGKGMIILTTSSLGYNSGTDMFGYRNGANAAKLLENLRRISFNK